MRLGRTISRLSSILWAGLLGIGLSARTASAEAPPKRIDLNISSPVTSIATRAGGRGYVVAFNNCEVAFLDKDGALQSRQEIVGCLRLFTVHVDPRRSVETVTASIYTGHAAILSAGRIDKHLTHAAAVTDVYLAFGGLLTSSDDGTVVLSSLDGSAAPKLMASGQGVARILLPDRSAPAATPTFYQGFDSGRVAVVAGERTQTFETGVGRINGMALADDRKTLYVGGFNGRLRELTPADGVVRDIFAGGSDINGIGFDGPSARLAAALEDGRLVVYDMAKRTKLLETRVSESGLTAVALSGRGRQALVGDEKGHLSLMDLP